MKSLILLFLVCFSFTAFSQSAGDEKEVRAIIQSMEEAYNAHDYSFSGKYDVFTDDAVLINPVGMYWQSRPEIISGIQTLGAVRLKYETAKYNIKHIRFLAPTVALVVLYSAGRVEQDYTFPDGTKGGTKGEVTNGMYSFTLVKQKGSWKVSSMQITHIDPKATAQTSMNHNQVAEIILTNGKIFTSDTKQLYVQALAIGGNKILAVGSKAAINQLATPKTKRIDLQGKTVVPGFNQAHEHLGFPVAPTYTYTEYNQAGLSKAAVLDSIARLVRMAKPNQWITGPIGTAVLFDTSMRATLDSIAPHNPVMLYAWWGHGQVVNKKALETAGLKDDGKDPVGGWYIRSAAGKINSIMENAQMPVWTSCFGSDYEGQINGLRSYAQEQLRGGFTTVQQMSSNYNLEQSIRFFTDAKLPQRIRIIAWPHSTPSGRQVQEWNVKTNRLTPLVCISGIKYLIDGTPIEQYSLNKQPYTQGGSWYGRLDYPVDTMRQILKEALTSNRQLMMHIVGDSSVAVVLSLMKQMADGEVWRSKRVRIEHNPLNANATDSELASLKNLGIMVMHTPRYNQSCRMRSLLEKGVMVGISPDGGATNPFWDIMVVTSQQANPAENITREQAVIAYTKTNAFAEFKEKEKGTLAKGMLADLAVLSQDIFIIPTEQLPATQSVLTMVDGKIVYQNLENMKAKK